MTRAMQQHLGQKKERIQTLQSSYAFRFPKRLYAQKEQQFDLAYQQFQAQLTALLDRKSRQLERETYRLEALHPHEQLKQARTRYQEQTNQLRKNMNIQMKQLHSQFQTVLGKLNALSPLQVMERGYSLAYKEDKLIKSVSQIEEQDRLEVKLKDGVLTCEVLEKRGEEK